MRPQTGMREILNALFYLIRAGRPLAFGARGVSAVHNNAECSRRDGRFWSQI